MSPPSGWKLARLGDILIVRYGKALQADSRSQDGEFPVLGSAGRLTGTSQALTRQPAVVVGRKGAVGAVHLVEGGSWPLDTTYYINVPPSFEPRFLAWQLRALDLAQLDSSTAVPSLRRQDLEAQSLLQPELHEQRRIVDILEDHLSRLDAAGSGLASITARAEALLASQAAVSLAAAGGQMTTIGTVSTNVKNGVFVSRSTQQATGVPILRIGSVRPMKIDFSNSGRSGLTDAEVDAAGGRLAEGDVLFTRYNGNPKLVASAAVVPAIGRTFTYPDKLIRVRVRQDVVRSEFLAVAARWGATRTNLQSRVKTTSGQAGISGADLKATPLILPSLAEQDAIIARIGEVAHGAAALIDSVSRAHRRSHALRRALLAAAFSGQLAGVASDSDRIEELASAL
ncbi:restriction endonuclease subunit S [Microbacterium sp. W1N]|uniref:restriction endonuclease subunit S n=1 Tax=Microbacterium festucae TaxID=2977531 RepID=UPI0021C0C081|nr:restriction endonuclease subunit S [Microbacterium festucae]MCT9821122.1 restriction endonuclease subunit S [Microbacterium festucae]